MTTAKNPRTALREVGVGVIHVDQPDMAKQIEDNIKKVQGSEKVTKKALSELSRDLLTYIVMNGSPDVGSANRLLSVLTPVNRRAAILFFAHFLPFKVDSEAEHIVGGKLKGEDRITKKTEAVKEFLADPKNDIWIWAASTLKIESKETDWGAMVERNVKMALEKGKLEPFYVVQSVINGGIKVKDLVEMIKFNDERAAKDQKAA